MKFLMIVLGVFLLAGGMLWWYIDGSSARLLIPLLMAGGLASVVQALIETKNVLVLPQVVDKGHVDLGFVADLLIGMIGAFASLIVGVGTLNDRFFQDPVPVAPRATQATTATSGTTPGKAAQPSPGGTSSPGGAAESPPQVVDPISIMPTWMRIASFGALTGFASRRVLPDLSNRISTMVSGAMARQVRSQAAVNRTQNEMIGMLARTVQTQEQAIPPRTHLPLQPRATTEPGTVGTETETTPPQGTTVDGLHALVREYVGVRGMDEPQRSVRRQEISERMPGQAMLNRVSSEALLERIQGLAADDPELQGWLTALASVIAIVPSAGDGARLLGVVDLAAEDFARDRFLTALYSLRTRGLLQDAETTRRALDFINGCARSVDPSLRGKALAALDLFVRE
jgi:hypothetical protein